jgi:hypothetical protein
MEARLGILPDCGRKWQTLNRCPIYFFIAELQLVKFHVFLYNADKKEDYVLTNSSLVIQEFCQHLRSITSLVVVADVMLKVLFFFYSQDPSLNDWLVTPTIEKTVLTERGKNTIYKYGHYIILSFDLLLANVQYIGTMH